MRQFCWNVFSMTGNIEAYLLYKEFEMFKGYTDEQERVAQVVIQDGRHSDQKHRLR
jgi:hypothetical protein